MQLVVPDDFVTLLGSAAGALIVPSAPAAAGVANQVASVGALDLAAFDGHQLTDANGGALSAVTVVGGTPAWLDAGALGQGKLRAATDGAFAGHDAASLSCTCDLGGFNVTFSVLADTYVIAATTSETNYACDDAKAVYDGGKTIAYRPGTLVLPADNPPFSRNPSWRDYANQIVITSVDDNNRVVFKNVSVGATSTLRDIANIYFTKVRFEANHDLVSDFAATNINAFMLSGIIENTVFEDVEFFGHRAEFDITDLHYTDVNLVDHGTIGDYYCMLNHGKGSAPIEGLLHFKDCQFHGALKLLNLPGVDTGANPNSEILIEGCEFYDNGLDYITFMQTDQTTIRYCVFHSQYSNALDIGHTDFIQRVIGSAPQDDINVRIYGCVATPYRYDGKTANLKFDSQGLFIQTGGGPFSVDSDLRSSDFIANALLVDSRHGFTCDRALMTNSRIVGNSFVATDGFTLDPYINITTVTGSSALDTLIADNAVEDVAVPADAILVNNGTGITANRALLFYGSTFTENTIPALIAALQPAAGEALATATPVIGAFPYLMTTTTPRSAGVVDHPRVNRVSGFIVPDLTDQVTGSVVESSAVQISSINRYDDAGSQAVAASNGAAIWLTGGTAPEARVTSDSSGNSVIVDWTSGGAIVLAGQYFWVRDTTSFSHSTQTDIIVNVGDQSDTWSITTEAGLPSFPVVEDGVASTDLNWDHSLEIALPANIALGDLLVIITVNYANSVSPPSGYTRVGSEQYVVGQRYNVFKRPADGSEGTSVVFPVNGNNLGSTVAYRISGASGNVEVAFNATGDDPPALSPTWGSGKTLWIAAAGHGKSAGDYISGPAGYSGFVAASTGDDGSSGGNSMGAAWAQIEAASEDPGTFADDGGEASNPTAWTIAVEPS